MLLLQPLQITSSPAFGRSHEQAPARAIPEKRNVSSEHLHNKDRSSSQLSRIAMTSTSSTPFSLASLPNDRHPRVLEAHIVIHILILSTAILLLMQLISHTAAAEAVESYDMPDESKKQLMRMFFEGTKLFSWVFVYLFVSSRSESTIRGGSMDGNRDWRSRSDGKCQLRMLTWDRCHWTRCMRPSVLAGMRISFIRYGGREMWVGGEELQEHG